MNKQLRKELYSYYNLQITFGLLQSCFEESQSTPRRYFFEIDKKAIMLVVCRLGINPGEVMVRQLFSCLCMETRLATLVQKKANSSGMHNLGYLSSKQVVLPRSIGKIIFTLVCRLCAASVLI